MISRSDLTPLIDATPQLGVSLFLSTHKLGRETRQNPIGLKNLLSDAHQRLSDQGLAESEINTLLAPATELVEDYDFWQNQEHGLAVFLSDTGMDTGMQVHKLPFPVQDQAVVGPGFHIAPLLILLDGAEAFVVLTATAESVSTHLATRFGMSDLTVNDMPASIESLDELPDYEGSVQSHGFGRPNTGGQSMPKTQVYGDSPEEWRKGRLVEFTRRIGASLASHLARTPLSVVVVADAEIGGHIAKSETLAPHIAGTVEMNPATLDPAELHDAAWSVMQPIRHAARDAALNRLQTRLGQGDATACTDPAQVIAAAHQGRAETIFLVQNAALSGTFDPQTGTATVNGEESARPPGTQDLPDLAARLTLRNGGDVCIVAQDALPGDSGMAAILRY
jgi:hypothetical protein